MKREVLIVLALCALTFAYPKAAKEDDVSEDEDTSVDRLYIVPLEQGPVRRGPTIRFGLSEDLEPPPSFLSQHPFFRSSFARPSQGHDEEVDDFMTQMQAMMTEMRRQIAEVLHRSHPDLSAAGDVGSEVGTRIGDEDSAKNKSTSTTKVIDGHVVTVNETTYSSGDDNIGAVFRIKVVEVKPSEGPETEGEEETEDKIGGEGTSSSRDPEPTTSKSELEEDNHEDNEIPNNSQVEWGRGVEIDPTDNEIDDFEPEQFSFNEWTPNNKKNEEFYDLRHDTRVNDFVSDQEVSQGLVMVDPEAEFIGDHPHLDYYKYDRTPQRLQSLP